jgi:hypothetical protein
MSQVSRNATVSRKIDRSSYRRNSTPFGHGILPPASPAAPTLTPSQLQAQIAEDLIRIRELGARQDALAAQIRRDRRRAEWASKVDAIYSGVELG